MPRTFTSLRTRLALLVLIAVAPALGLALYTSLVASRHDHDAAADSALRLARIAASRQDDLIEGGRQLLTALSLTADVRGQDPAACGSLLAQLRTRVPGYDGIAIASPAGDVVCSAAEPAAQTSLADRAYFQQAVRTRAFTVSEDAIGRSAGKTLLTLALPVLGAGAGGGDVSLVLVAGLDLAWLDDLAAHFSLPGGDTLLLVDRNGVLQARQPDSAGDVGQPLPAPLFHTLVRRGEGTTESVGSDGVRRLYGFTSFGPADSGVRIVVGIPRAAAYADADTLLQRSLSGFLIVTILALATAWLGGQVFIVRRVKPLLSATRLLAAGDWRVRSGLTNAGGEIGQVGQAFDLLAAALAERQAQAAQAEAALRASEERFRSLVQHSSDIITVHAADGAFTYASPSTQTALGYHPDALLGKGALEFIHPEDAETARALFEGLLAGDGSALTADLRFRHADGSWVRLEVFAKNRLGAPGIDGIVINSRDISERLRLEDEVKRQAFYDGLTGLPNRNLFMERLGLALTAADRHGSAIAALFVDLDGFKLVNDSLGHHQGDLLLGAVARRLAVCLRPGDTLARFGGDEFTVLIADLRDPAQAVEVGERLIAALRAPFVLDGHELFVTASVGVGVSGLAGVPPADEILREADIALYRAKAAGKNCVVLFEPTMNVGAVDWLDLQTDLQHSVRRGELVLHYQPEIDLASGAVIGMEALLRWQHPHLGLIGPAGFIPLAEETGLVLPIGRWALREACRQTRQFLAARPAGAPPLVVAVNLSARQFSQPDLVNQVADALQASGLSPAALRLEITETTAMQAGEATGRTLRRLKELGVGLAIDDFGTGYSSLSYLQDFAVDTLKVDRSFVSRLTLDPGAEAIVRAVTMLAHALGIAVTAEGIETAEQLACVRRLACDRAQGYYFARPLSAEAFAAFLRRERAGLDDARPVRLYAAS